MIDKITRILLGVAIVLLVCSLLLNVRFLTRKEEIKLLKRTATQESVKCRVKIDTLAKELEAAKAENKALKEAGANKDNVINGLRGEINNLKKK